MKKIVSIVCAALLLLSVSFADTAKGESWWRNLSKSDRDYYFVRADESRGSASEKYFMYQIRVNGQDAGVAKPMCVIKEKSGTWKVKSF